jgi:hypothetical protein
MPDTVFWPTSAFQMCLSELVGSTEVVLGCWTHSDPSGLDTVVREGSRLVAVNPKPRLVDDGSSEAWGIAAWTPQFTKRLEAWSDVVRHNPGFVFQAAAIDGRARGVCFRQGEFSDLGTYALYEGAMASLNARHEDASVG